VPPEPDPEPAAFARAWQRWQDVGISSYALRYVVRCDCPDRGTVAVVVRHGVVVHAQGSQSPLTVDTLLAVAQRAYAQADRVTASYDPSSGVPLRVSVDIDEDSVDDEVRYDVLRFAPGS